MDIPPPSEWLTPKQVANKLKVSEQAIRNARYRGRKSYSGEIVRLQFYRTAAGLVTTQKDIDEFHRRLNR